MADSSSLTVILIPCFVVVFVTSLVLSHLIVHRLANHHPAEYREMGKPVISFLDGREAGNRILTFILKREHRTLNDPLLSILSDFSGGVIVVGICLVAAGIFLAHSEVEKGNIRGTRR